MRFLSACQFTHTHLSCRESQINAQIAVINKAYAGVGISWVLAGITRTVSWDWFNYVKRGALQETAMMSALKQGGVKDLNVYTVG